MLDASGRVAVGVVLQVLATFLAALAYILQKQAHLASAARGGSATGSMRWRAGFALMVLVAVVDVYCFSLLDQSTLGAFGAATLAWNVVLARLILREESTWQIYTAVALIAGGTVVAVSSSSSAEFTLAQIIELAKLPRVIAWCALNFVGIAGSAYFLERAAATPVEARGKMHDLLFSVVSPVTGGMCMGFTRWGAKAVSTTLFGAEWSEFTSRGNIYGFLFLVCLALFLQVRYLNKGLENADAMRVVPVFQAAIVFSNSMGGVVFYGDMINESTSRQAAFALGALIAIVGVAVLVCVRTAQGGAQEGHTALGNGDDSRDEDQQQQGLQPNMGGSGSVPQFSSPQSSSKQSPESPLLIAGRGAPSSPQKPFVPWPEP